MRGRVRCQALDDNGKQCRRAAIVKRDIHGDSENRDVQWSWVRVDLCATHDLSPKKRRTR